MKALGSGKEEGVADCVITAHCSCTSRSGCLVYRDWHNTSEG